MSGERYIKQAIIAALCEHPEQDRYKTRAFSGERLEQVMEALSEQRNTLCKADFFMQDDEGRYLIDTPGFWRNFSKIADIVRKSGDVFTQEDFLHPVSPRDETRTLLESAAQFNGLTKVFSDEIWKGRFDEMERLWFRVPMPARRDAFHNDGLLDPALKRRMLAAEGRAMPEDGLERSGLTPNDLRNAFMERGNYDEVKRRLEQTGDYLRKDYVLMVDSSGDNAFFYGGAWDRYADITRGMKEHGEMFEISDFIRQVGTRPNMLVRAAEKNALDKVFSAEQWEGRLPEMMTLWSYVLDGWKASSMKPKDFDRSYAEAENRTYADQVDFGSFIGKKFLLTPLPGTEEQGAPVRPLGLRSFWDNSAKVQERLQETGERISVADLREKSGHLGDSCLLSAVKSGNFDKVLEISRKSGDSLLVDDFLSKDSHGNTMLSLLAERNQLAQAFAPDLWADRVPDMKRLWTHVRVSDRIQVDIAQVEVTAKQLTLAQQAGNRPKLRPKKPGAGGGP